MKTKKEPVKEKAVLRRKTYFIETIDWEDGTSSLNRTNDGFNPLELIGVIEYVQADIIAQMKGAVKPDIVKRTVIED